MKSEEYKLHCDVVEYITIAYPHVEFRSDGGGLRLPIGLAVKAKRLNGGRRAWPDLFIAQPVGNKCGLFIEIKTKSKEVYTLKGALRNSLHIQEQAAKLKALRDQGYAAFFGTGFIDCRNIIDAYLNQ
jgi:hypothetical protein